MSCGDWSHEKTVPPASLQRVRECSSEPTQVREKAGRFLTSGSQGATTPCALSTFFHLLSEARLFLQHRFHCHAASGRSVSLFSSAPNPPFIHDFALAARNHRFFLLETSKKPWCDTTSLSSCLPFSLMLTPQTCSHPKAPSPPSITL